MKIKRLVVGPMLTNCYILIKNNKCLIIDPGAEYESIKTATESLEIIGILITHYHFDHVGALIDFFTKDKIKVYDYNNVEDKMKVGPFSVEVIKTPGHKDDALTYYFKDEKVMFVGDFVFKNSIGRCDFDGGNEKDMIKSIELIKKYDDDITIYPGHGEKSTLGIEKKNNIYFQK